MIDPRIPLMGQQQADPFESAAKGIQFGQGLRQLLSGRQAGKMAALAPEERQAFANNSMFSRELNAQLKADTAAQEKAMYDRLKTEAEISKIGSEAYKNNQQGGGYALDNSGKTQAAIESVIQQAAMTGDPGQVLIGLNRLAKTGLITPEQYRQETAIINAMKIDESGRSEELQKYAQGSALTNKEVAPYLYQTANNVADNEQSEKNSQRTYDASIYSTDTAADTADKNRAQQQSQFEAKQAYDAYLLKNKPVNTFTDINGYRRHEFADGSSMVVQDENGQPVKAQQKSGNLTAQNAQREETQRLQRVDAILPEIEKILPNATSSYVGAGADFLGRAIGYSTDGAKATAQLKTLAGQLVSLMPKMSGPQSDKDVAMYKEMAGNLADDTQPIQTRMAALQTIKELNNKYKGMNQQSGVPYANAGGQTQSTFNLFD